MPDSQHPELRNNQETPQASNAKNAKEDKSTDYTSTGMMIGMLFGVAIAVALDNWAYVGIGLALGLGLGAAYSGQK